MKNRIKLLLGASLCTPVLMSASVYAIEGSTNNTSNTTTQTNTSANETEKPETLDPKELQARIDKRKTELKSAITQAEQTRLKAKCTAAQAIIKGIDKKATSGRAVQSTAYDNLSKKLGELIPKLKAQSIDTTKLEQQKTELDAKITTYKTDVKNYLQALADTAAMGCMNDPAGFKASVESARSLREKVVSDASGIRTYINGTIKPTLVAIRTELAKAKSTEGGQ